MHTFYKKNYLRHLYVLFFRDSVQMVKYSCNGISGSAIVFYALELVGEAYLLFILLVIKEKKISTLFLSTNVIS